VNERQIDYANYLMSFDWDTYHTQTFKRCRHDGTNAAIAFWGVLEDRLQATRGFISVERHRLGGVHLHSLVSYDLTPRGELRNTMSRVKKYCDKAFGFTNIQAPINQATVSLYCAKYVTKADGEYFFLGKGWEHVNDPVYFGSKFGVW